MELHQSSASSESNFRPRRTHLLQTLDSWDEQLNYKYVGVLNKADDVENNRRCCCCVDKHGVEIADSLGCELVVGWKNCTQFLQLPVPLGG
ncbi:hypothetical protein C0Q70_11606 [Pomacea canaliculata]|uniref:Uncharacterized protein n=1 Tax=Pomacea canaliculata TaxID=400727 RepID=A0A2T7P6H1_POMCA|nr:hypothetical protein C0Q70_11606 [Pomacea canaliculata]